jgi:hypothetical protein
MRGKSDRAGPRDQARCDAIPAAQRSFAALGDLLSAVGETSAGEEELSTRGPVHAREIASAIGVLGFCHQILIGPNNEIIDGEVRFERRRPRAWRSACAAPNQTPLPRARDRVSEIGCLVARHSSPGSFKSANASPRASRFESPQLHQVVCASWHDFLRHRIARRSRGLRRRQLVCGVFSTVSAAGVRTEVSGPKAPRDPVPVSLAAWCYGLRAGHHFTACPTLERDAALQLASRASSLRAGDPLSHTILSAAYALAHDFTAAAAHARRALAIDGGSSWGWGRLAWVHCYRGETAKAVECCRIARTLGPTDPLGFLRAIGIAAANFQEGRYNEAVQWYRRALAEQPKATWLNRFLAPASLLGGDRDAARQSLHALSCSFPELTISQVMTGLPHTRRALDLVAEGLASLSMPRV